MNLRKHIMILLVLLGAPGSVVLAQDYLNVVCAGDTGVDYSVQGSAGSTFEWTVEGGLITRNYGDSIIVEWDVEPGEYEISVQETSQFGCLSPPVSGTVLVSAPDIELGDDAYICEGQTFTIEPEGLFYSFEWHDGSTLSSYTTGEEETISVRVSDEYGCFWEDEMYLEVKDLPVVDLGNDTSLCGEQMVTLDAGYDGVIFNWSTGDVSRMIDVYQGFQQIWVTVEDQYGCVNSDSIVINECDPGVFFKDIPTAITPNNDGNNDVWRLEKLEAYPDAVVDIYDRWGNLVFRSEPGYPRPWDGTDMRGNNVPMDSYHFVILLNFGEDDRVIGTVTVIR